MSTHPIDARTAELLSELAEELADMAARLQDMAEAPSA